jgi:hypothetical protein
MENADELCRILNYCYIFIAFTSLILNKRNPQSYQKGIVDKIVDNVDNYIPNKDSPIFTMSPAPIVINKSPLVHFSNKKFSI